MYSITLGPRCIKWKMAEFVRTKVALLTRSPVNVCIISKDFLFVSLVTNRVSPVEVCLPSFDVLNCWLNLAASCLDDVNELPLKVIVSFSASRFALPSIPLLVVHSLVRFVFWSKVSTKSLHFVCEDAVLDVIIQSCQFRHSGVSFTEVISSCHHIQHICWYRFLVKSLSSGRDVV